MSFRASADQEKLLQSFSLEGLCQAKDTGAQKTDMLCQWRGEEDREYRYMVKSTPEQGAAFTVTVILRLQNPNENPELPDLSQSDISDVSFLGYRILLVEDNEINCEIIQYILKDAGAKVMTAHNGKTAVDAFTASAPGTFDCILMDLMMPVMSGYEAARVIRSLNRTDAESVPIIALSANAFEEDVAMAKDAGMNEHLAKPIDIKKMFQVMSRLRCGRQLL